MNLADVMQEIADQLGTINGLRVSGFPPDSPPHPPAAIVSYPGTVTFDGGYGRGMDMIPDLTVVVLVGRVSDRTTRDRLGAYADGSGDRSIKQVLEAGTYAAFDSLRVGQAVFEPYEQAGNPYLSAVFTVEITGRGA